MCEAASLTKHHPSQKSGLSPALYAPGSPASGQPKSPSMHTLQMRKDNALFRGLWWLVDVAVDAMKQHAACRCPFPAVDRPTASGCSQDVRDPSAEAKPQALIRPSGPMRRAEAGTTPDRRPGLRLDLRHVQTRLVKIEHEASWCRYLSLHSTRRLAVCLSAGDRRLARPASAKDSKKTRARDGLSMLVRPVGN